MALKIKLEDLVLRKFQAILGNILGILLHKINKQTTKILFVDLVCFLVAHDLVSTPSSVQKGTRHK